MTPTTQHETQSTAREYLAVLRRRRWIVILCALLVPFAAVALSLREETLYEASADVLLTRQDVNSSLTGIEDPTQGSDPERYASTQASVAAVPEVAGRVLKSTGTPGDPHDLLENTSVSPKNNADLLEFAVTDPDPARASALTTAYAREFTDYRRELDSLSLDRSRRQVEARLARLRARGEIETGLYDELEDKNDEIRGLQSLQNASAVLVRPAGDARKVQPKPVRNGLIGLVLGLALGIGLAFLRDALDTRLRSAEDVGEDLGLPLLARVARPPRALRQEDRLVMFAEPHGPHAEAFRVLRTNLDFVNLERGARVIMVTSAVEAEGKSTTAANLAIALARAGRRVMLVDLDLRRPYLQNFFAVEPTPGLTDVALGHADLDEAISHVALTPGGEHDGGHETNGHSGVDGVLQVLPSGPLPPNAGDFVNSRALVNILSDLRDRADIVLIDSPPLLSVGDALALSAHVDGLILVTRLGVIRKRTLQDLEAALEASPGAKLGFVLCGADEEDRPEDAGYYYHRRPVQTPASRFRERV